MSNAIGRLKNSVLGTARQVTKVVPEEERALETHPLAKADGSLAWYELEDPFDHHIRECYDAMNAPFLALAIKKRTEFHRQSWAGTLNTEFQHMDKVLTGHGLRRSYSVSPLVMYTWGVGMIKISKHPVIRDRYDVTLITSNKAACDALIKVLTLWVSVSAPPPAPPSVYALTSYGSSFAITAMSTPTQGLERGNYEDAVLRGYDNIVKNYGGDKPVARLSVIEGPTGTGKTHFISALVTALPRQKCIYVPSSLLSQLDNPAFLRCLIEQRGTSMVLIVEDGDSCLMDRKTHPEMTAGVSSLLNLTDGFIGNALDLRVVITANLVEGEMDEAITREGRMLSHVRVGPLSADKALSVYRRLSKGATTDAFTEGNLYTLANVYARARKA